jgi:16S rRNA (guanine527-N7)-methyltransferase
VDGDQEAVLARYGELLAASPHNLVSRAARGEVASRHVPESRAVAATLPGPGGRLLDIGSGGGLPGFVIAIVRPDLDVHLLEATGKKAQFLRGAAEELQVPVTVHEGRAEVLGRGPLANSFDIVTARAVAPLGRLVGLAAPFLAPGGQIHAIKGARWVVELEEARSAISAAGLAVASVPEEGGDGSDTGTVRVVVLAARPVGQDAR